ncbi:MAG TPA: ABC transporter permease subunit [Tepidisphaeraceae bacterium]|jgi:ABC-type transport system involved in multi-copper enzyme maturation permease subunit|nr:ABC transporter permease subunit [Tepidisphaeraceae bacterium]
MSFATFLQGVSPFGPIFAKELRVTARRKRSYLLRVVYLSLLLLVLLWAYGLTSAMSRFSGGGGVALQNQQRSMLGQIFFGFFACFTVWVMALIGPVLTSTAIGSERLQKTLPVLLMTPITSWQIVGGKLLSRLLVALTLLGLSLPVLALVRLLGGVEIEQMVGVMCLAVIAALSTAAIGLFYSTLLNRSYAVILLSYGTIVLMYLVAPGIIATIMAQSLRGSASPNPMAIFNFLRSTNPYFMALSTAAPQAFGGMSDLGPWAWCVGLHLGLTVLLVAWSAAILRRMARGAGERPSSVNPSDYIPVAAVAASATQIPTAPPPLSNLSSVAADERLPPPVPVAPPVVVGDGVGGPVLPYRSAGVVKRKSRATRSVSDNPILWREVRRPLLNRSWQRVVGLCLTVGLVVTIYALMWSNDTLRERDMQTGFAFFFTTILAVIALVISATAIAQEKEGDTWTLLLATPVSGKTIVWGKALGVLRRLLGPSLLIVAHFLLFTVAGVIDLRTFLVVLWTMFTFNTVWVATGVYFSLRCRKVTVAVIVNLLLGLGVYLVVPGILAVGSGFTESKGPMQQVAWYMPYYYQGAAVQDMRTRNDSGTRLPYGDYDYGKEIWVPTGDNVSWPVFIMIAFIAGCAHLVAACLVLAHTAHHFNRIVGRAQQRNKLTYADNLRSTALPRMKPG